MFWCRKRIAGVRAWQMKSSRPGPDSGTRRDNRPLTPGEQPNSYWTARSRISLPQHGSLVSSRNLAASTGVAGTSTSIARTTSARPILFCSTGTGSMSPLTDRGASRRITGIRRTASRFARQRTRSDKFSRRGCPIRLRIVPVLTPAVGRTDHDFGTSCRRKHPRLGSFRRVWRSRRSRCLHCGDGLDHGRSLRCRTPSRLP